MKNRESLAGEESERERKSLIELGESNNQENAKPLTPFSITPPT